jgi:hypothetical protein
VLLSLLGVTDVPASVEIVSNRSARSLRTCKTGDVGIFILTVVAQSKLKASGNAVALLPQDELQLRCLSVSEVLF